MGLFFEGGNMAREKIGKIVGYISNEIANDYNLHEYENQEIIQSLDLYVHVHKHIGEFKSIDNYNNAVVLMHDAAGKTSTIEALPIIIESILASDDTVLLPISAETVKVQHRR